MNKTSLNLHMTHIEDCVLNGVESSYLGHGIMQNLYAYICGVDNEPFNLTVKYDGAPAVFVWSKFPGLEVSGVAMKGLFNEKPIIYTKYSDMKDLSDDLAYKLQTLIKYKPKIPVGEIWQGDFLFDDKSLKQEVIDGKLTTVFHPNTIMYAVPDSLNDVITKAKIGIVWHTIYKGPSLQECKASYDFTDYSYNSKKTPEIFMIDAQVNKNLLHSFAESEYRILEGRYYRAKEITYLLDNKEYREFLSNPDVVPLFKIYQNSIIKEKTEGLSFEGFLKFLGPRFEKEIESRKTDKGKDAIIQKRDSLLKLVRSHQNTFNLIVLQINNYTAIKEILIKKLNESKVFETYLKMKSGNIRKTDQEGFALSDNHGNVVKLVNREEFSYANFSDKVLKGWSKNI